MGEPGKILALVFATMCLLNWALDLLAALVMNYRMQVPLPQGATDNRGYIAGIWYRNFAPSLGYVLGLPILVYVIYKTRSERVCWRLVWIGFLVFALLIAGDMHFTFARHLPLAIQSWYFEIAIGIPVVLLAFAVCLSLARRDRLDWWTVVTAPLIIVVWVIVVLLKASAT